MAKPLSQEEIDVLLQARSQSPGAVPYDQEALDSMMRADTKDRVHPYNFKRPRLFAQDQMRVLHHVHESFARDFSVYLSAQLRTIVDISLTAVDQVLYSEYVMSSAPPSALYVVDVQDMSHKMLFEIDPRLVIFTIEKLFGGPGEFLRMPREVSQIEQRIMSKVMARAYSEVERAWKQVFSIKIRETAFESNAEFVQIMPSVEPALVATFEVTVYEQRSFINVCYPYLLLERMLGRAGMKQWISSATSQVAPEVRTRYEDTLRTIIVEMHAELGRARLPVNELVHLEVGDVIPLQRRVTEPIKIYVSSKEKFQAAAGRAGKYRALRILKVNEPQQVQEIDELF
ncbi:MAG: flagellar motor switch protein FliM [Rhodothermales bacterium]